jgi:hypothetical protein
MADYYTQTSFAVHVDAREAEILPEIDKVIDAIQTGFDAPEDEMTAWQDCSERFRQMFPADDPAKAFARFTALFNDETYPSHGADIEISPDPEHVGGTVLYASGDGVDPFALAALIQKVLPSALPFRFGWAETCSRMRIDAFGGGFIEVQAERIVPLLGLGQEIDASSLVIVIKDPDCGLLFWNNEAGLGPLREAKVFTRREADQYRLPCVTGAEPGWLELPPLAAMLGDLK